MFVDTHSHIYQPDFDHDRNEAIQRAQEAGVELLLMPDIDSESREQMFNVAQEYPQRCLPMLGLHPTSVNDNPHWQEELAEVERLLAEPPMNILAVGEIGLDLYWSKDWQAEQQEVFEKQLELSLKYDLPVVIHTRAAWGVMCETLERFKGRGLRGVLHAFSDSFEIYERIKRSGNWVFGIGGVVTYKNSKLGEVVNRMTLEDIVLETDSPYLTPAPHRGKRNESAYITYIAECIAQIKGVSIEEVANATTENARRVFKF